MNKKIKKYEAIKKQVENKRRRLKELSELDCRIYGVKVVFAKYFLMELDEVISIVYKGANIELVTMNTMKKMMEKSDYCLVEYDGEYCKLVEIYNFPYAKLWLLYVAPVEVVYKK